MATLWIFAEKEKGWRPIPLREETVGIGLDKGAPGPVEAGSAAVALILPWGRTAASGSGSRYLLVSRERVLINGLSPLGGLRALRHKDEISLGRMAGRVFFSNESLAQVGTYPGSGEKAHCPRCKDQINQGQPSVRCPRCSVYYHQQEGRDCYTYGETCVICGQRTALGTYSWVPDDE